MTGSAPVRILAKPNGVRQEWLDEYTHLLLLRVLAYRWLAEAACDEALKSIYGLLWQSVVDAKRTWMDALFRVEQTVLLPNPQRDFLAVLQANAALPPSTSGVESMMDWVNELDDRQHKLARVLLGASDVPLNWKFEFRHQRDEWSALRGPLRYLTQYAHQFVA